MKQDRQLFLAGTLGFCNGVRRALDIVAQELAAGTEQIKPQTVLDIVRDKKINSA